MILVKDGKANPKDIISGFGSGWYMSKEGNKKNKRMSLKFVKYITYPKILV